MSPTNLYCGSGAGFIGTGGIAWAGASDVAQATDLLRSVTSDPESVLTGIGNAEFLIANHA